MCELALYTGIIGDWNTIYIEWFDENNIRLREELNIIISEQDKPRIMEIHLNGIMIAKIDSRIKRTKT